MSIRAKYTDPAIELAVLARTGELLVEKGVNSWNVDELARRTGLAKNTLYRIIGSKEKIIRKTVLQNIHSVQKDILGIMEEGRDYHEVFMKVVHTFPLLINNALTGRMKDVFLEYPSIESAVKGHYDHITESIISFFRKGMKVGALREDLDPENLFEMLQIFILGFIKKGFTGKELTEKIGNTLIYLSEGVKA